MGGFGVVQVLAGATLLSELGIDINKNWQGYRIVNLSDPAAAQDADTFAARVAALASYLLKSGGTMTGPINMGASLITNLGDPVAAQDAATRAYVLARVALETAERIVDVDDEEDARALADSLRLLLAGGTMTGAINMGNNLITNLPTPVSDGDAARKKYVDDSGGGTLKCTPHYVGWDGYDRAFDTIYRNTSSYVRVVVVSARCQHDGGGGNGTSKAVAYMTQWSPPDRIVASTGIQTEEAAHYVSVVFNLVFFVPPNAYYNVGTEIYGKGLTPTLQAWTEYDLWVG